MARRISEPPKWRLDAACAGQPVAFFFEDRYLELAKEFVRVAQRSGVATVTLSSRRNAGS